MDLVSYIAAGSGFAFLVAVIAFIAYLYGKDRGQSKIRLDNAEHNEELAREYAENNANDRGHAVDRLHNNTF